MAIVSIRNALAAIAVVLLSQTMTPGAIALSDLGAGVVMCVGELDLRDGALDTTVRARSDNLRVILPLGTDCTDAVSTLAENGLFVRAAVDCPPEHFMRAPSGLFCFAILFTN